MSTTPGALWQTWTNLSEGRSWQAGQFPEGSWKERREVRSGRRASRMVLVVVEKEEERASRISFG